MMDAMGRTREHLLHDAIRETDDWKRITFEVEHKLANLRRAFLFAGIIGGVGWLMAWALAVWGLMQ